MIGPELVFRILFCYSSWGMAYCYLRWAGGTIPLLGAAAAGVAAAKGAKAEYSWARIEAHV